MLTLTTVIPSMDSPEVMNISEAERFLLNLPRNGSQFCSFDFVKEPDMLKTGNPYLGKIVKVTTISGCQINFIYDNAVRTQLVKEGKSINSWNPGSSWQMPITHSDGTLTPLCSKKDGTGRYLYIRELPTTKVEVKGYFWVESGEPIPYESVSPFLPKKSAPKNQNLKDENAVIVRTYGLDGIRNLRVGGKQITITV